MAGQVVTGSIRVPNASSFFPFFLREKTATGKKAKGQAPRTSGCGIGRGVYLCFDKNDSESLRLENTKGAFYVVCLFSGRSEEQRLQCWP